MSPSPSQEPRGYGGKWAAASTDIGFQTFDPKNSWAGKWRLWGQSCRSLIAGNWQILDASSQFKFIEFKKQLVLIQPKASITSFATAVDDAGF